MADLSNKIKPCIKIGSVLLSQINIGEVNIAEKLQSETNERVVKSEKR